MRRSSPWRAAALVLTACDVTGFDAFRTHTPVLTFVPPVDTVSSQFGAALAVATDDTVHDWLVVSAGLGSPVSVVGLRAGTVLQPTVPPTVFCDGDQACGDLPSVGVALGGVASWLEGAGCAATGAFAGVHHVALRCVGGAVPRTFVIDAPTGFEMSGFGLSLASVRRARDDDASVGSLLFVGAPAGDGHVFVAQPTGVNEVGLPTGLPAGGSLGDTVAAGRARSTGDLVLAAGGSVGRVMAVFRGDPRAGRPMTPVGCVIGAGQPGFGGALALGDLDGDGDDEVVVGSSGAVPGRLQQVQVYRLANAPGTGVCEGGSWPATVTFACADDATSGVRCTGVEGGFGGAIGSGDLDVDGRSEVIVGAPQATVDGVSSAGAVWVLRAAGVGAGLSLSTAHVLRDGSPMNGAHLGGAITVAHLGTRDEIVAGEAPSHVVRVFLCSGIAGDQPGTPGLGPDCRPM